MSNLLITNACAVLPDKVTEPLNILVSNGKIEKIGVENTNCDCETFDANGGLVFPGFVEVHVHGGGGADFMDADVNSFETAVKSHLKHGTTTLLPTAMSATEEDLLKFLSAFKEFKTSSDYAYITPGVHLEGPYFSGANAKSGGAQPMNLLRLPDMAEVERLLNFANGDILRWDAAPELEGALEFAQTMKKNGILCAIAHSNARSEEAQHGIDNGFSHVTHFYNAVTTYHKEDQTVCGGVVEAAYLNPDVTVELICDGKHIPRDVLRLALMIKGAEKVSAITDGMRIAGTNMQNGKLGSLKNGTDVIVDDGVAKLPDMSSFAGSIATMDRCLKVLCVDYGIDIITAAKMLSLAPAKLLKAENIGEIKEGFDADLVITDKKFCLQQVVSKGKII